MSDEITTPEWVENIQLEDDGLRTTLSGFDTQEAFFEKIGYKPPEPQEKDWREFIEGEDGQKYAERFTDLNSLVSGSIDMRKQLSSAIVPPGKDASDEQIAAYRKAIGIPRS